MDQPSGMSTISTPRLKTRKKIPPSDDEDEDESRGASGNPKKKASGDWPYGSFTQVDVDNMVSSHLGNRTRGKGQEGVTYWVART